MSASAPCRARRTPRSGWTRPGWPLSGCRMKCSIDPRFDAPAAEPDQVSRLVPPLIVRELEHEVPVSEAVVPEAVDYVVHLCGLECYERWRHQSTP
ncbi:MAG TPA: DUF3330 domain-containing protein [Myxococcota bacterium]|nr:DUF3330 domain-containing protein [Myxococcota bacterium]